MKDQEELQVAQSLHQAWGPAAREGAGALSHTQPAPDPAFAIGQAEHQRVLLNRLLGAFFPGHGPGLPKELAGTLGFPSSQAVTQEDEVSQATPSADPAEGSGPRKMPKQARIKSQGPYGRPGESPPGAGARSTSAPSGHDESTPERPAEGGAGDEAEQL